MDSPPLKVIYEELPEQPFTVHYNKAEEDRDISTPNRKVRITARRCKAKKHPKNKEKVNSLVLTPADIPDNDTLPNLDDTVTGLDTLPASDDTTIGWGNEDPDFGNEDPSFESDPVPKNADLTYLAFVEAVLSDECSFYQLSQKVFVANGWDPVRNEATVRVSLLMSKIQLKSPSLYGIISKGRRS